MNKSFEYIRKRKAEQYTELMQMLLDMGIEMEHHVNGGLNFDFASWITTIKGLGFEDEINAITKEYEEN